MVRIGKVSSVDSGKGTVRVIFPTFNDMPSGELKVIQRTGAKVNIIDESAILDGTLEAALDRWFPEIGQLVLCLYLQNDAGGDGVVLGGL